MQECNQASHPPRPLTSNPRTTRVGWVPDEEEPTHGARRDPRYSVHRPGNGWPDPDGVCGASPWRRVAVESVLQSRASSGDTLALPSHAPCLDGPHVQVIPTHLGRQRPRRGREDRRRGMAGPAAREVGVRARGPFVVGPVHGPAVQQAVVVSIRFCESHGRPSKGRLTARHRL